jgi:hypothetical protein
MAGPDKHYRAFISYSQQDKLWGKRIHAWLETYRVPVGSLTDIQLPRRLGKFFRDEEDMSAASDIAEIVRRAIEDAESLIVICSPRSAQSKWVNAEIQHFRRTGRARRVFAVIIDGVPNSGDKLTECFPPALRAAGDPDDPDALPIEPLGLDVRKDGRAKACARLAAGLLGVDFDDLWQRDRRRAEVRQRLLIGSLASIAIVFASISAAAVGFALQADERAAILSIDTARASLAEGQTDEALLILLEAAQHFRSKAAPDDLLIAFDQTLQRAAAETVIDLPDNPRIFDAPAGFYIYDPSADAVLLLDSGSHPRLVASDAGDPLFVGEAPDGALILVRSDLAIDRRTQDRSEILGAFKNDERVQERSPRSDMLDETLYDDTWPEGISPDGVLSFAGQYFDLERKLLDSGRLLADSVLPPLYARLPDGDQVLFAGGHVRALGDEGDGRIVADEAWPEYMRYRCWGDSSVNENVERQFDSIMGDNISVECAKSGDFLLLSVYRLAARIVRHDYLFYLRLEETHPSSGINSDLGYDEREYNPLVHNILTDALRDAERSFVYGGVPLGLLQRHLDARAIAAVPAKYEFAPSVSDRILAVGADRDVVVDTPELTYYWRMRRKVGAIRLLAGSRAAVLDADLGAIRVLDFSSPHLYATRQMNPAELVATREANQAELREAPAEPQHISGMTFFFERFGRYQTCGASIVAKDQSIYRRLGTAECNDVEGGVLPTGELYFSDASDAVAIAVTVHTLAEAVEAARNVLAQECGVPPGQSYRASPCWPKNLAN